MPKFDSFCISVLVEFSPNGGTNDQAKQGCADVKNPEQYLLNPKNPYFVKTLTKKNDILVIICVSREFDSLNIQFMSVAYTAKTCLFSLFPICLCN